MLSFFPGTKVYFRTVNSHPSPHLPQRPLIWYGTPEGEGGFSTGSWTAPSGGLPDMYLLHWLLNVILLKKVCKYEYMIYMCCMKNIF